MSLAGESVDAVTLGEQRLILAAVALLGCHEADRAMAMVGVILFGEALDPSPRFFDRCEAAGWPVGGVLAGPEPRFEERVVIDDARAAGGRDDAELLHRRLHRCALHRAAVVGAKNERAGQAPLGPDRAFQDPGGELGRFTVVDFPVRRSSG